MLVALAVHLPMLMMRLPLKSYDAYFHIFFASHYVHHWFDPWNTKWYAGFSQTTYPPLPQQWIAVISHAIGLEMGYMVVQLAAILLLVLGVYRFSLLWVGPRAASLAALASIFLGSETFLVYGAGQLATTSAAPIYLNALPYMFRWIRYGSWRSFLKASVLFAAAAAAHHATLIFGSFLFALPVLGLVFLDRETGEPASRGAVITRTVAMVVVGVAVVIIVLLPFWLALIQYPVTQAPIPHPSRANFLLSPHYGINYFLVPWGAMIFAMPFILLRGSSVVRLRPLLLGFWVAFLIGLGGTTPVGRILLGRAYYVITMERFTYWASLLALPFVGLLASELINRFRMKAMVGLGVAAAATCAFPVSWASFNGPEGTAANVKVGSTAKWLNRDGHDKYRYFTLGFGESIAQLAVLTDASSVDGEWNSGRRLPELMKNGSGALTSSKYFGAQGIDALKAMMRHCDKYGIKWIFVHDPYYDPLLQFAGWRRVDELDNNTIAVWSKDGVPPATPINAPERPPRWQGIMWGTLPFGSGLLAILVVFIPESDPRERREFESVTTGDAFVPRKVLS